MAILYLDTETYSEVPIKHGTYRYAADCEIMIVTYALDENPVSLWDLTTGDMMPDDLAVALSDPGVTVCAHNSMFDRTVMRLSRNFGLGIPLSRWHDTMVQALAHSLPGALGTLCDVLKVPHDKAKDKRGKQLINLFCKPRPKNSKEPRATRLTHPTEWEEFKEYAMLDVDAMREVKRRLPTWNYQGAELALWRLDQKINDRGFLVDVELASKAVEAVNAEQQLLRDDIGRLTSDAVGGATQRDAMLDFIMEQFGVYLPDLTKATVDRRLNDPDIPQAVKDLLAIRVRASSTGASKYKALLRSVNEDARLRGTLQFCGASRTGRWSGRNFQPQNLPRPSLKNNVIELGIEALKLDCADLTVPDIIKLTSSAVRGCIIAPPSKKLVVSDLSNIEGRDQAWLAGEEWKLQAFRDFDSGQGYDLYKLAYAKSFGVTPDSVTGDQRQIGKVQELALGYEGGVGAFVSFAIIYGIVLDDLADKAYPLLPDGVRLEAEGLYDWLTKKKNSNAYGLSKKTFVVCDSFKRLWREAHPNIASHWKELGEAARYAIANPGDSIPCRKVILRRDKNWLRVRLPSGRFLCYPSPQMDESGQISYMGMNQYSRKFERIKTFGGKIFENMCQAVARDVMTNNMAAMEDGGFDIVLTVHDEVVTEAPDDAYHSTDKLSTLLATAPSWAPDMPLAAAGFEGYRYKKG